MQVKIDVQLRCNACDTVLSTSMVALEDKDGFYAYVEPCPKCAAQQMLAPDANWSCSNCGYVNKGDWQECRHCQTPRR